MFQRLLFNINAGSTPQGDTGRVMHGEIVQMHWNPTVPDTGADLKLAVLPKEGDTGDGWEFGFYNDCMGVNFTKVPCQPIHGLDGAADPADTGSQAGAPVVLAGDRLRIKVIPGGAACAGRLYVWLKS